MKNTKRFRKIYIEISNICNLSCSFCAGTRREKRVMSPAEFKTVLEKTADYTDFIYLHVMGEPLCHPRLEELLELAAEHGKRVIITTNGTKLYERRELLLSSDALHKVNVSLHASAEGGLGVPACDYLRSCFAFGREAIGKKLVIYRLWNGGEDNAENREVFELAREYFPLPWAEDYRGKRLCDGVYLDYAERFEWPDMEAAETDGEYSCYGLSDHIGILADGSVVPCCLDHDGDITLGNIFCEELSDIIGGFRAERILKGFRAGCALEPLCKRCGYARAKFSK